jgi:hypothetical protein
MSARDKDLIQEEGARAVWLRAAQLQAEAARRLEEESRALPAAEAGPGGDGTGLKVDDVRAAALEAGIAPEFVDLALAEHAQALDTAEVMAPWQERQAERFLRSDKRIIEATRTVPHSPERVLEAMQEVVPKHPYFLTLHDSLGDDPVEGGTLVFKAPGMMVGSSYTTFGYTLATVGIKEVRLTMRPVADGARTEMRISTPLHHARKTNWLVGTGLSSGVFGTMGGLLGLIPAKILALSGAVVAAPIVVGAVGLAGLTGAGWAAIYRHYLGKAEEEFEGILKTIDVTCRLGTGFRVAPPPSAPSDGSATGMGL